MQTAFIILQIKTFKMTLNAELHQILLRDCSSLGSTFVSKGGDQILAQPSNRMLFAKIGPFDQVMGEAESLNAMHKACLKAGHSENESLIPTIHTFGPTNDGKRAYLVTDYKDLSGSLNSTTQRVLGTRLAEMHSNGISSNGMFGFERPTHCGETEQDNTWTQSWPEFWAERRIGDLVRRSGDRELVKLEEQLRKKVYPLIFCEKAMKGIQPAIIHGDLWSGNSGSDRSSGQPIIFDPSSSYSHNEAELGIMKMFGGYGDEFFEAYHQVIPRSEPYYDQRIDMYEAYHHLNHFVIFGGGYRSGTIQLFNKLISWADLQLSSDYQSSLKDGDVDTQRRKRGLQGGARQASSRQKRDERSALQYDNVNRSPSPPSDGDLILNAQRGSQNCMSASPAIDGSVFDMAPRHKQSTTAIPTAAQIADFFSQMVCFIWFSTGLPSRSGSSTPARSPTGAHQPLQSSPLAPRRFAPNVSGLANGSRNGQRSHAKVASTSAIPASFSSSIHSQEISKVMQNHLISTSIAAPSDGVSQKSITSDPLMQRLQPKGRFLRFIRELLGTTQLSTSVITLSLIYVYRLKLKHPHLRGREGSEYRVAISALMLANKILDDNTYLNKTWAEISGMPLVEISKMEVEFWLGLKMEMHVSKEDYDDGLRELQLLSNERTRLIRERETILKHFALQQQQHGTSQYISRTNPAQTVPMSSQHQSHLNLRQSIPNAFQHAWPPLTAIAAQAQPLTQRVTRHSVGNGEILTGRGPCTRNSITRPASPDLLASNQYIQSCSPQYQQMSYTMPSSPLSQGSGVPSLATASNEALTCTSEVEGSTPQDYTSSFSIMDPLFPFADTYSVSGQGVQSQLPVYEQQNGRNFSPFTNSSQSANAVQCTSANGMMIHSNQVPSQPPAPPTSFSYGQAHNNAPVNSYKKEFDRVTTGSLSPQDARSIKRLPADVNGEDGYRSKRTRYSSSGFPSPSERSQWTRQQRPMSHSSPFSHVFDHSQQMRASLSPSYAIQFARLASPSTLTPSLPSSQTPTNYGLSKMPTLEDVALCTMATNPELDRGYGKDVGMTTFGGQNGYHSVFSSALTPNSLAAPLQISNGARPIFERARVPLKYYSLAAGEARGNLGHYIPPTNMLNNGHYMNRPNIQSRNQFRHMQSSGLSSVVSHQAANSKPPSPSESFQMGDQHPTDLQRYGLTLNDRIQNSVDHQSGLNKFAPSQVCHTMATTTPTTEFGLQPTQPWELGQNVGAQFPEPLRNITDGRQVSMPVRAQDPPPFAFDPHGWPLADSSSLNTFIFPYHLVPFQHQQA